MKKVESIDKYYKIDYEENSILGKGTFGVVRPCQKIKVIESSHIEKESET